MRTIASVVVFLVVCAVARAGELAGIVLNDEGKPAAGATVHAAAIFHKPPLRMNTVADDKGAFQLDVPRLSGDERYALAVRWRRQGADVTEGVDSAGKTVSLKGRQLPPLVVRLRPAGRLRGKLLRAEDDGPIAGAKLFLDTGEVLVTDKEGQFEVEGLRMDEHSLIPSAPGRVRRYVLFDTSLEPEAELEIRLARGAVVKGRITDEAGNPISDGYLTRSSSGTALTLNGWDETCRSDATFEYGGLSSRRLFYSLEATAPGYESQSISSEVDDPTAVIERDVTLKKKPPKAAAESKAGPGLNTQGTKPDEDAQEKSKVEVRDESRLARLPHRTIRGVVTGDGKKIAGAKVRWGTFQWDASAQRATTDDEGNYALAEVPGADGALFVVADGYAPQFAPAKAGEDRIDVHLSPGATVRGIATNSAGRGVPGVQVIALTQCMETGYCNPIWIDERSARTDEQGAFEIDDVPTTGVRFDILKTGYSEQRNVTLTPGDKVNEIQLTAGGAVRGRVVDAAGEPVRNFNVRVMIPRVREPNERVGGYYAGFDWYGVSFTRPDGVFVMSGVGAGSWLRLVVTSPGVGRAVLDRVQAGPLDALAPAEDLTIKLVPYAPLVVRVVESGSGKPLAGARVALLGDELFPGGFSWGYHDLWGVRERTDPEGTARFAEPNCEDGTLIVRAGGMARKRAAWTDGAAEVTVELDPAALLQGEVSLGGKRLADGWARLASAKNDFFSGRLADREGRFEFDQLPEGDYTLSISGANGQPLESRKITLEAGKAHSETFDLPADIVKRPDRK
jgi:Carboxypeptidase regulatory-like domain